ncbi:MAG: hypothetical protein U5L74_10150 [Ideonella sp.]|nr:hypothetical protein [Ideonella sp.]
MITYQADKREFLGHTRYGDIEQILLKQAQNVAGHGVGPYQVTAWKHSLMEMFKVLDDDDIPDDAGVAIEYQLLQSAKRIDF